MKKLKIENDKLRIMNVMYIFFRYMILFVGLTAFVNQMAAQISVLEIEVEEETEEETEAFEAAEDEAGDILLFDSIPGDLLELLTEDYLLPPLWEGLGEASLLEGWHSAYFFNPEEHCIDGDDNPYFPDSIYRLRMNRMMTVIPMTYNETVRRWIDVYAGSRRNILRYMMGMANFYFPMFEQILDANDMPLELKYLPVVESALKPMIQSRVGASGLWQFMLPTGKIYGLEINSLIDERLDPERATEAACRYFKDMFARYGDWHLALAAYNCGPGGVDRAIRRAGGVMDFWKIYQYLPRETRSYVPLFIATAYIMTYHCDHNICPVGANFSVATDTIMVERALHFDQIAEILHIDKEAVRFYNPQYKREIIPGHVRPSALRLPIAYTFAYIDKEDSVHEHRVDELLAHCVPVDVNNPKNREQQISHTVKTGENVYTIANQYGVTAQNLRRWNGLSGSRVPQGRKLRVYIDNGGLIYFAQGTNAVTPESTQRSTAVNASLTEGNYSIYQVKSGDTLSAIARKYPGVTWQSIQQANGMTSTSLRIGQVLKIPR